MHVVQSQHQTALTQLRQERCDRTMQPEPGGGALDGTVARGLPDAVQHRVHLGEGGLCAGIGIGERVREQMEGNLLFILGGPSAQYGEPGPAGPRADLVEQPAFADAGFTDDVDDLRQPGTAQACQHCIQPFQLRRSAYQSRHVPVPPNGDLSPASILVPPQVSLRRGSAPLLYAGQCT